jgi:predicted RNA-binding protein with PUA-like domain
VKALARPVTLAEIKAEPKLAKMELIRQSRLSVAPVRDEEWLTILRMAGK